MSELRVETLPKSRASVYVRRAEKLLETMEWAEGEGNADGLATNAIQAAISLGDAFTVWFLGRRSRAQDHHEVLLLIRQCKVPAAREVSDLLQGILSRKTEVEYQSRQVQTRDARQLAAQARALSVVVHRELA
jgi:hypothetical protein